jgi:thiaminase/transcriptional activator TenA
MVTVIGRCDAMRADVSDIWEKIYAHPFLRDTENNTIAERKLKFYFTQNYQYIEAAVQFFAIAAGKAPDRESRDFCLETAATANEKMQEQIDWANELPGKVPTEMAPANHGYTRHLLTLVHQGGTLELLTGLLPCPWTYDEFSHAWAHKLTNPVTSRWLAWWASDEHKELVDNQKATIDRLSEGISPDREAALATAFRTSSRYEYMFWDMAYNEQFWPV